MINLDQTKDESLKPDFFTEEAARFFAALNVPIFKSKEQAGDFIETFDATIDTLVSEMKDMATTYSDETILLFGSALGEALRIVFDASWEYSDAQNRWVISRKTLKGDKVEFNVFRKLKKRIENGMDDSIGYYFVVNKKIISGELAA